MYTDHKIDITDTDTCPFSISNTEERTHKAMQVPTWVMFLDKNALSQNG